MVLTHFIKSVSLWSLIACVDVSGGKYLDLVSENPFVVCCENNGCHLQMISANTFYSKDWDVEITLSKNSHIPALQIF